jgi:Mg/Co/Ni transporter MgtE
VTASAALVERYVATHPREAAQQLDPAPADDAARVCGQLSPECAAVLLPHLAPVQAAQVTARLAPGTAAAVLQHVPLDLAAWLLRAQDVETMTPVLAELPSTRADAIRALLEYEPGTAGAVMDPEVLAVSADATVEETRALLQRHPAHLYYYVYALDSDRRLAGVCDLAELLQAAGGPLRAILRTDVICLAAGMPLAVVFTHSGWAQLDALPVVGPGRRFLGVLRHRRMRQLLERDRPAAVQPGVRTMMALGEIYWLGLCGLLQGIASTASTATETETSGNRGRS